MCKDNFIQLMTKKTAKTIQLGGVQTEESTREHVLTSTGVQFCLAIATNKANPEEINPPSLQINMANAEAAIRNITVSFLLR